MLYGFIEFVYLLLLSLCCLKQRCFPMKCSYMPETGEPAWQSNEFSYAGSGYGGYDANAVRTSLALGCFIHVLSVCMCMAACADVGLRPGMLVQL